MMKSVLVIVALLCLVSLPNPTIGLQKPWPKPSDLANHNGNFGDSKVGWACSSSSDPNSPPSPPGSFPNLPNIPGLPQNPQIPGIPNIPQIPQIPGIPNIPRIPNIPEIPNISGISHIPGIPGPFESVLVSQSSKLEKCLTKEGSKVNEKCFSQIFSSWAENDFVLDKECCEIIVNMDKKCNDHLHVMFKSHFFAPLLQYSCHIKHAKKN